MKRLISIVIPIYNEEDSIPKLIKAITVELAKILSYEFEVLLVENGSIDESHELLQMARKKDKRIKILQLAKNVGCDGGIVAGLTYAKGDAAIVMMADLQEDPKLIKEFLKKWESGFDVVYGIVKERKGTKMTRKIGTYLFYRLMNMLSKNLLPSNVSDFRLLDRKVYLTVVKMPEHNKFFRGLVAWSGFKQIGIPFIRKERVAGNSKADFKTVYSVAMDGIFSFSDAPAKMPFFISALLFIVTVYLILNGNYELAVIAFLFAITMTMLYMQNEYLRRIMEEVRNRPQFIVQETFGIDVKGKALSSEEKV